MPFVPQTREEIRTNLLNYLYSRYSTAGQNLLTIPGSDAYLEADALSVILEAMQAQSLANTKEFLPDQATTTNLDRHGFCDGVDRESAVSAVLTVRITGTPSASISVGSRTLESSDGFTYTVSPSSFSLNGSGYYDASATCLTPGTDGNQAISQVLSWSSAPTNANPTATVQAIVTTGENEETDESYSQRIIQHRRERPASGNRSDWKEWCETVTGVTEAFVYPLHNGTTENHLGWVTVVCLGPKQGSSATDTTQLSAQTLTNIEEYIEGNQDKDGGTTGDIEQRRPVTMKNYNIINATGYIQDVSISVQNNSRNPWSFPYDATYLVLASPTPTTTTFSLATNLTSVFEAGMKILVNIGTSAVRGSYQIATIQSVAYTTQTNIVLESALEDTPVTGNAVLPHTPNYEDLRDAVFDYFDSFGPGDAPAPSERYPTTIATKPADLYKSALASACFQASGVVNASVITPASDVIANPFQLIKLGKLSFLET